MEKEKRTPSYVEGENKAWVRILPEASRKGNVVAYVNINYEGFFFNDIAIKLKDDGTAYFNTPVKPRMGADGKQIVDEKGYKVWDNIYGPATKEKRTALENFLMSAVEAVWEE